MPNNELGSTTSGALPVPAPALVLGGVVSLEGSALLAACFSILTSTEPAAGAILGLLALGRRHRVQTA